MDMKRFLIGTIVGALGLYISGYLIFDVAVAEFYATNRGPAVNAFRDAPLLWSVGLAGLALSALITLWIMSQPASQTITGGFIAGGVIGFLVWFHADFTQYGYTNVWTLTVVIVDPLLSIVYGGAAGSAIAAVLAKVPASPAVPPMR